MGANKYRPHVVVLPEDDADQGLAVGFALELSDVKRRQFQIEPVAGGWGRTRDLFESDHLGQLRKYPEKFVVLLVDFDEDPGRLYAMRVNVPDELADRVFVFGAWKDPEQLGRSGLGSPETVGRTLARECRSGSGSLWDHELLRHNAGELARFREIACSFLFP